MMEEKVTEKKILEQEAAEEIRDVQVECESKDTDDRVLEDAVSGGTADWDFPIFSLKK